MPKGYIYILSNPSMPGLVKIGRSVYGGRKRAGEINQTGVPSPFVLEMEILIDDHEEYEAEVHNSLSHYRESENREFFRIDVQEAIAAVINNTSESHVMRVYESILDEDTIAEFTWNLSKQNLDFHPFEVASALHYLSLESVIQAMKKYNFVRENRRKQINLVRFGEKNV